MVPTPAVPTSARVTSTPEPEAQREQGREVALEVQDVSKHFSQVHAVDGVTFSVAPGELVSLLGPSGCGKSTLLRLIAGIEWPDAGRITSQGRPVSWPERNLSLPPEARGLGMVFQSYALWPHMTVEANVEYPLRCRRVQRDERNRRVADALRAVRLDGYEGRHPGQLSGGQQQRVALARALVAEPAVILLDEPLSNLDARLRDEMRVEIKRLQSERGLTMVYVTHDQAEAMALSDRIVVMDSGRVVQIAVPEDLWFQPASASVAHFLGGSNALSATALDSARVRLPDDSVVCCTVDGACKAGEPVRLVIRPHSIRAAGPDEPSVRATVMRRGFLGVFHESVIRLTSGEELVAQTQRELGQPGDFVSVVFEPAATYAFPLR